MGGGMHGGFGCTRGAAAGAASFMKRNDNFSRFIKARKDVDPNGMVDVVAHGSANSIEIQHAGKTVKIGSRTTAKLVSQLPDYKKGQPIRLLSCSTGSDPAGFAQNLANKLNVVVYAPNKILWAWERGRYIVADKSAKSSPDGTPLPDMSRKGKFVRFVPGGNK